MKRWGPTWRCQRRSLGSICATAVAALTVQALLVPTALAQSLTWGATGAGGSGAWDTTTPNWFDGSAAVLWSQRTSAIFGGAAGTVTLGVRITAQDLTFGTSGYELTGTTLTLGAGSTPTANVAAGSSATISSIVAGTRGLTVTGGGTLTLR